MDAPNPTPDLPLHSATPVTLPPSVSTTHSDLRSPPPTSSSPPLIPDPPPTSAPNPTQIPSPPTPLSTPSSTDPDPRSAPSPSNPQTSIPPHPTNNLYETPSPPSSNSSGAEFGYGTMPRRRRAAASHNAPKAPMRPDKGVSVALAGDALGNISPIPGGAPRTVGAADAPTVVHRRDSNIVATRNVVDPIAQPPYSDMPDSEEAGTWAGTSYVPVMVDDTARLMTSANSDASLSGSDGLLNRARADLEKARRATNREFNRRDVRERWRDQFVLGCSLAFMLAVVFVIVVSGMTTILTNRNYPQLEVFSDWPNGGIIPLKYGCHAPDGSGGVSFPLHWRNVPRQATNLAVLFAHPGAIAERGMDPVHWFITNIPVNDGAEDGFLPANASANPDLMPEGAIMRANFRSKSGSYWPPCYINGTSFFVVHVYAVEAEPTIDDFKDAREIINRFVGVPVARLTGHYGKQAPLVVPGSDDAHGAGHDGHDAHDAHDHGDGYGDYGEDEDDDLHDAVVHHH